MRVGFITGEYPPMPGGVGAFTRETARAMVALGHSTGVFTRRTVGDASEEGIIVSATVDGSWGWRTITAARKWALDHRFDVVNVQFQTAAFNMHPSIHYLPGWFQPVPVVVTFHDLRVPYLFPKAGRVRQWIVRKLAQDAAGAIATNRIDEATLREAWRISRTVRVPIGSNVSASPPPGYDRNAWRQMLGLSPADLLISHFGFVGESKGTLVLIDALAALVAEGVPAHLVMIGERVGASDPTSLNYNERVDARIDAHGLESRVHWTGFMEDAGVSAAFLASDVTALPYLDGVSLRRGTLMAALAHRRAIVTTTPQMVEPELEGALEIVPPASAEALAEGIRTLWARPGRRRELEQAAGAAAEQFTWDRIARQTLTFFEGVLEQRKAAP